MLMSAKKNLTLIQQREAKKRERECAKERKLFFFCFKRLSEQIIEDTYEYSLKQLLFLLARVDASENWVEKRWSQLTNFFKSSSIVIEGAKFLWA